MNHTCIIFLKLNLHRRKTGDTDTSDEHSHSPQHQSTNPSLHLNIPTRVNGICDCKMKLGLPTEIQAKMNSLLYFLKAR